MTMHGVSAGSRGSLRSSEFFQPRRAAFWLYLLLLVPLAVFELIALVTLAARAGPVPSLAGFGLIVLAAWILIWVIRRFDLFKHTLVSLQVGAFVWGGLIAGGIAGHSNNNLSNLIMRANPDLVQAWDAALVAPVTEEALKALGVVMVVLIAGHRFHRLMDGLVYGAFAGLGFQMFEDLLYMFRDANPFDVGATLQSVLSIFVLRVIIFGAFSHATYTALVGFGIAYYVVKKERPLSQRLLVLASLFIAACLFHFLNNGPLSTWPSLAGVPQLGSLGLLTAVVPNGVVALGLAIWLYDRARRDEDRWFRSAVAGDVGTDVITAREADALSSLRRRRRARKAARQGGGRAASRLVAELQGAQIAYALAKDRSQSLDPSRQRIEEVRGALSALARPSLEGA